MNPTSHPRATQQASMVRVSTCVDEFPIRESIMM